MRSAVTNILYYIFNVHKPSQIKLKKKQYNGNKHFPVSVLGNSYRISTESECVVDGTAV